MKNKGTYNKKEQPRIYTLDSYFPKHYINPILLFSPDNFDKMKRYCSDFKELVNSNETTERRLLNFLKNDAVFIVGTLVKNYTDWGHHDLYVFNEFPIGTSYKADFLIVGKNSYGYHFMFIEFENIYGKIVLSNGDLGKEYREGISQLKDWKNWIEKNFSNLFEIFDKYKNKEKCLPEEFRNYESHRFSYTVIAGRRKDYKRKTYSERYELKKNNIILLHYDNLIDTCDKVIKEKSF